MKAGPSHVKEEEFEHDTFYSSEVTPPFLVRADRFF